jgi:hypothetical protein
VLGYPPEAVLEHLAGATHLLLDLAVEAQALLKDLA